MTFGQFCMFHDFSMTIFITIFIFKVFQSLWNPAQDPTLSNEEFNQTNPLLSNRP